MSSMTEASDPLSLRDRLLEATYRCVERFGMAKTTIDDVAKESGVSRATIYRQFAGGRDGPGSLQPEADGRGARAVTNPSDTQKPRALNKCAGLFSCSEQSREPTSNIT